MVTRTEVRDTFEKDGTYLLLTDLFRRIVDVKKRIRSNDLESEDFCQFIKYVRFNETKISDHWFSTPVYETTISGTYKNTELELLLYSFFFSSSAA